MIYEKTLTVPPNTPENAPVEIVINPGVGRLMGVQVIFMDGCLGAVGIRLMDEHRQFAPLPSGWMHDSANWGENIKLQGPPYRVTVQGISSALDWPHKVRVRLEVIR